MSVGAWRLPLISVLLSIAPFLAGCPMTTVPDVVGLTRSGAEASLSEADLNVGTVSESHSEEIQHGVVMSQRPSAGASVSPNSSVALTISLGPESMLTTVPNLSGLTEADAAAALSNAGLNLGSVTTANSEAVATGRVFAQDPAAGASVAPGSTVSITVSLGPTSTVPDLSGLTRAGVESALAAEGLTLGTVGEEHSETIASGLVISQVPASGSTVAPGSPVAIIVSNGPPEPNVTVPNLLGLTQAQAEATLNAEGLVPGEVSEILNDSVEAGRVVAQAPQAGSVVSTGSSVAISISLGPKLVAVPSVVGLPEADAETALTNAGLSVGGIEEESSDSVDSGLVISQQPPGDTQVGRGTSVLLTVSTGPISGGGNSSEPDAFFMPDKFVGLAPLRVRFLDRSTENGSPIFRRDWNFGDPESGSQNISGEYAPEHVYKEAGVYDVLLEIENEAGVDKIVVPIEVIASGQESTPYTIEASRDSGPAPLTVVFRAAQQGDQTVGQFQWNFMDPDSGEENTSTAQNVVHTFEAEGVYVVQLSYETSAGSFAETAEILVDGRHDVVLAENAIIIDNQLELLLDDIGEDYLSLSYSGESDVLPSVGDVLVGSSYGGYLRRVTSTEVFEDHIMLGTEDANLSDVIVSGGVYKKPEKTRQVEEKGTLGSIGLGDISVSRSGIELDFSESTFDLLGLMNESDFSRIGDGMGRIGLSATSHAEFVMSARVEGGAAVSRSTDLVMPPRILRVFVVPVGYVPVVIAVMWDLKGEVKADFNGGRATITSIRAGYDIETYSALTFFPDGDGFLGVDPDGYIDGDYHYQPPTTVVQQDKREATLSIGLNITWYIYLYGIAGPTFTGSSGLAVKYTDGVVPATWTLSSPVNVGAALQAGFDQTIYGTSLSASTRSLDLFKGEVFSPWTFWQGSELIFRGPFPVVVRPEFPSGLVIENYTRISPASDLTYVEELEWSAALEPGSESQLYLRPSSGIEGEVLEVGVKEGVEIESPMTGTVILTNDDNDLDMLTQELEIRPPGTGYGTVDVSRDAIELSPEVRDHGLIVKNTGQAPLDFEAMSRDSRVKIDGVSRVEGMLESEARQVLEVSVEDLGSDFDTAIDVSNLKDLDDFATVEISVVLPGNVSVEGGPILLTKENPQAGIVIRNIGRRTLEYTATPTDPFILLNDAEVDSGTLEPDQGRFLTISTENFTADVDTTIEIKNENFAENLEIISVVIMSPPGNLSVPDGSVTLYATAPESTIRVQNVGEGQLDYTVTPSDQRFLVDGLANTSGTVPQGGEKSLTVSATDYEGSYDAALLFQNRDDPEDSQLVDVRVRPPQELAVTFTWTCPSGGSPFIEVVANEPNGIAVTMADKEGVSGEFSQYAVSCVGGESGPIVYETYSPETLEQGLYTFDVRNSSFHPGGFCVAYVGAIITAGDNTYSIARVPHPCSGSDGEFDVGRIRIEFDGTDFTVHHYDNIVEPSKQAPKEAEEE